MQAGGHYVGVDLKGERKVSASSPRQAAIVLEHDGHVLAISRMLPDGTIEWHLPRVEALHTDVSLHATGVRGMQETIGITEQTWRPHIREGPYTHALPCSTYYMYCLNSVVPQVLQRRHFGNQDQKQITHKGTWKRIADTSKTKWHADDAVMLRRLAVANTSTDGGGGC